MTRRCLHSWSDIMLLVCLFKIQPGQKLAYYRRCVWSFSKAHPTPNIKTLMLFGLNSVQCHRQGRCFLPKWVQPRCYKNASLRMTYIYFLTCHCVDPSSLALRFRISVSVPQEMPLLTTPEIQRTSFRVSLSISALDPEKAPRTKWLHWLISLLQRCDAEMQDTQHKTVTVV